MEDAVALALLITAVTEKALTLCQVDREADDENKSRLFLITERPREDLKLVLNIFKSWPLLLGLSKAFPREMSTF